METSKKRGQVVVVSGPSGVGKSTVCRRLCEKVPAEFSVSVTTRKRRINEEHARDYHYISPEEFAKLKDSGGLLESAEVYGHWYGTPLAEVETAIAQGRVIVLEIDIKGCIQVRRKMPDARTFFLLPPTSDEQRRRIEGRRTDDATAIRERLSQADGEIRYAMESGCYDDFIINDDLNETVDKIYAKLVKNV
ncbi:MAG TPA: guanylate kinase [Phycisphaerae bacterium]|nr:guanylate kinase [Phycisphaerae bacterium]